MQTTLRRRGAAWRSAILLLGVMLAQTAHTATPAELEQQRSLLLKRGEAALAALHTNDAWLAFERASYLRHAVDAETGIVRAYMQAGQYRRAIAFAAHTSGVHAGDPAGVGLYGWLLHLGGQHAAAERLLKEAEIRHPGQPFLSEVRAAIRSAAQPEHGNVPSAVQLHPYSELDAVARKTRLAGSAVLIDGGKRALVPLATLAGARTVWLRNGLGQLRKASIERRLAQDGLALLRLYQPMPLSQEIALSASDPFPGSVTYVAEFAATASPAPAWPILHAGFLGMPLAHPWESELGVELPQGPRGGPVFDSTGRLAGIALADGKGAYRVVLLGRLRMQMKDSLPFSATPPAGTPKPSADQVYETAMQATLQVLLAH
jgi:hypothetical protein